MSVVDKAAAALRGLHEAVQEKWFQPPLITDEDLKNAKITIHDGACPYCADDDPWEPSEADDV